METNREIWRSINNHTNYEVSCFGRVRNATTGRILKPTLRASGYYRVCLCKGKKGFDYLIHRLVAQEFIVNPEGKPNVDHIDHDTKNNFVSNLRWVSQSQNNMNSLKRTNTSSKFKGVSFNKAKHKWHAYINISGNRTNLGYFHNEKDAAKKYNEAAIELFGEYALINEFDESDEETEETD